MCVEQIPNHNIYAIRSDASANRVPPVALVVNVGALKPQQHPEHIHDILAPYSPNKIQIQIKAVLNPFAHTHSGQAWCIITRLDVIKY